MANYHVSAKAKEDIDRIWLYTMENWSVEQANKKFDEILDQIEFLAENNKLGKSYDYIREGLKGLLVNPHVIFYRKNLSGEIEVMRVLHQRMDLDAQL